MSFVRCLLLALAMALGVGAAAALDVPLAYEQIDMRDSGYLPFGFSSLELKEETPRMCKIPRLVSEKPVYGEFDLAGKRIVFALDISVKGDDFYKRILIDANGNGDLSDDKPYASESSDVSGDFKLAMFSGVKLEIANGDARLPYCLRAQVYQFKNDALNTRVINCTLISECVYTGKIESGGKTWRLALGDGNVNGLFDESVFGLHSMDSGSGIKRIYASGDKIAMTTGEKFNDADMMNLGTHLALDGKLYAVKIDIPHQKMMLNPVEEGLAKIKVPAHPIAIELIRESNHNTVMAWGQGDELPVPAGNWRPMSYLIEKTAPGGDLWRASAMASEDTPFIPVAPDSPATLNIGPPFTIKGVVQNYNEKFVLSDQVALTLVTTDPCGMSVDRITRTRVDLNSLQPMVAEQPPPPTYEIRTAEGKKVAQGNFEYG